MDRVLKDLQYGDNLVQLLGYMTILDHLSHVLVNAQGVNSFPTTVLGNLLKPQPLTRKY